MATAHKSATTHTITASQHIASDEGDWRAQLRDVIQQPGELLQMLGLRAEEVGLDTRACEKFPLKVPRCFARRMAPGDPRDPLLLQVLASGQELQPTPGYSADPVGETGAAIAAPGVIRKYHGRALLIVASGCAVNCRYCFRRHFPYADNQNSRLTWNRSLDYVRNDTSIDEVILSGGDPLIASDDQLAELTEQIADIPHVKRLRIHSRLPIVLPDRVTDELLNAITHRSLQTVMVVHCNHAREIDPSVRAAVQRLKCADITTLNQAVLLADVNDNVDTLAELSNELFRTGVMPYYLHMLDKVTGAAHFEVSEDRALKLVEALSGHLPGYLVPKLVREDAGAPGKTRIY